MGLPLLQGAEIHLSWNVGKGTELSPAAQGHKQSSFRECGGTTSQPYLSPRPCSSLCQLFRTPADAPGPRSLQPQLCDPSSLTATAHHPSPQGADFQNHVHLQCLLPRGRAVPDGKSFLCCAQSWFKSPCSVLLSWDPWRINKMWGKLPALCGQTLHETPLSALRCPGQACSWGSVEICKSSPGHTTSALCHLPLEHFQPPQSTSQFCRPFA